MYAHEVKHATTPAAPIRDAMVQEELRVTRVGILVDSELVAVQGEQERSHDVRFVLSTKKAIACLLVSRACAVSTEVVEFSLAQKLLCVISELGVSLAQEFPKNLRFSFALASHCRNGQFAPEGRENAV